MCNLKMCPQDPTTKTRTPAARHRTKTLENWRTMQWLNDERKAKGMTLRDIGKRLGYHNATRVSQYFKQKIVAGPDMVRRLALAVGVSPIYALWSCRRYSAVFDYLENLYRLGWSWMHEDRVHLDQQSGATFMLQWAAEPRPAERPTQDRDLTEVPPRLSHRYHQATIYNPECIYQIVSLPRPMACAILLGVGLFPRRGDVVRPETKPFIDALARTASDMLPRSDAITVPSELANLRRPLKEAEKVLPWRFYSTSARLAIVAEYVHEWCDIICHGYADFARIALYSIGGFVGDPGEEENYWGYQSAKIPPIEDLQLEAETVIT